MNSTSVGDWLEERVYEYFARLIAEGVFFSPAQRCKLYRKKGYYSEKRQANIVFDVAIELWMPEAPTYSILILVECKNYKHAVPVDDLEEFWAKVEQVRGGKGIVVSTAELQRGALNFARSSNIGYVRFVAEDNLKWVLHRAPSWYLSASQELSPYKVERALLEPNLHPGIYDVFAIIGGKFTNSWRELIGRLVGEEVLGDLGGLELLSGQLGGPSVEFLSKEFIRGKAESVLSCIDYEAGAVRLDLVAEHERKVSGLAVVESAGVGGLSSKIDFLRNQICVEGGLHGLDERGRFTLAHEFGHFYLMHDRYLAREGCDQLDVDLDSPVELKVQDVSRMEWQANYFAACLLLPAAQLIASFYDAIDQIGLYDKGHGPLFLDDQACNYESYFYVADLIKKHYQVSRLAVKYRLQDLGLLNDVRGKRVGKIGVVRW